MQVAYIANHNADVYRSLTADYLTKAVHFQWDELLFLFSCAARVGFIFEEFLATLYLLHFV